MKILEKLGTGLEMQSNNLFTFLKATPIVTKDSDEGSQNKVKSIVDDYR